MCNWDKKVLTNHIFSNCVIEDNITLYAGEDNWYHDSNGNGYGDAYHEAAIKLQGGPCAHDGTLFIRNNIFALAPQRLVYISDYSESYSRVFSGNTYIHYQGAVLVCTEKRYHDYRDLTAREFARLLGDEDARIVYIEQ